MPGGGYSDETFEKTTYTAVMTAVFVPPDEKHCFMNTGNDLLRLICVVPLVDGKMPG